MAKFSIRKIRVDMETEVGSSFSSSTPFQLPVKVWLMWYAWQSARSVNSHPLRTSPPADDDDTESDGDEAIASENRNIE